ncbi:MAG: glutamyl-tRNA reductase [Schleiferiaceae bacterium]|nr:glutamyl-tRNA reductase [Schleiferiaceae bacterium]
MSELKFSHSFLSDFHLVGISYETADVQTREKYSVPSTEQEGFMTYLMSEGVSNGMIISTCNRTELYCFTPDVNRAVAGFVNRSKGNLQEFRQVGFVKTGKQALEHLLRVCAGLESQIPGDFEIVGQAKKAFVLAKKVGFANGILERMVNTAVHGSKRVKNETGFSSGASSVSYATVRYIRDTFTATAKVLVYGLGEIGKVTLENLLKHYPAQQISVANRNEEKAREFAEKYAVTHVSTEAFASKEVDFDILVVATGAAAPIFFEEHFTTSQPQTIIDLSVPSNVSAGVSHLPNITLVDVDQLSQITMSNIERRRAFIPQVEAIVFDVLADFFKWYHNRMLVPLVEQMKTELQLYFNEMELSGNIMAQQELAQRIVNRLAGEIFNSGKMGMQACPVMMQAFKKRFEFELTNNA